MDFTRFCKDVLRSSLWVFSLLALLANVASAQENKPSPAATLPKDACASISAKDCLALAVEAMGGRERLAGIETLRLDEIGHTLLTEQSYRQDPFITSYERTHETLDFKNARVRKESHLVWPESDPGQAEADTTLIGTPHSGVYHSASGDSPCGLSDIESIDSALALNPVKLLLAALEATDLHFEPSTILRSTPHTVVGFKLNGIPTRLLLNPFNHLPDAIESTRTFQDFWYFWGDVRQRIYLDNFQVFHGLVYPTNSVVERNGVPWHSMQILNLEINVPVPDDQFQMDEKVAAQSAQGKGWERSFVAGKPTELAPGVSLYEGSWNTTLIKQDDGLFVLEAPISTAYVQGLFDYAAKTFPNIPVKAVFSTSDSWPHVGGVRQVVAQGLPVYILDLNRPLLDRFMGAPHSLHADLLAQSKRQPDWRIVSGRVTIGSGSNRVELYPIRGASTERQYMVYFPEHHLLYASDTLVLDDKDNLYDPELMREVAAAVKREGLQVTTVYAMHQGPTAWSKVETLLRAAGIAI